MNYDLKYLITNLSILSGVPTRIYKNGKDFFFYANNNFIIDPAILYKQELLNHQEEIGYISTKDFFYYSFINYKEYMIVIGPSRLIKIDDKTINQLAFELNIPNDDLKEFSNSMKAIIPMPFESLIQSLCLFNYVLNKHIVNTKDVLINDLNASNLNFKMQEEYISSINEEHQGEYNAFDAENYFLKIIENGSVNELDKWIKNAPAFRPGILSKESLRQTKNIFISSATLISRAAIKGNLDISEALYLSDLYIQNMEILNNEMDIKALQMNMAIDFCKRVNKIKSSFSSPLIINLNKYIISHLSSSIHSKDICKSLYTSKSVLFDKIKKETGLTLLQYINNFKINEAKNLLKNTNKSLNTISEYLGFSSTSHFSRIFKKYTSLTPNEYRIKKNNNF